MTITNIRTPLEEELLTIHEAAQLLRIHDSTLRRWAKNGDIEAVTLPQPAGSVRINYRIKLSTLESILHRQQRA